MFGNDSVNITIKNVAESSCVFICEKCSQNTFQDITLDDSDNILSHARSHMDKGHINIMDLRKIMYSIRTMKFMKGESFDKAIFS